MPSNLLHLLLVVFAFACFIFAAWQHASPTWNRIVAVGLAAFVLSFVL